MKKAIVFFLIISSFFVSNILADNLITVNLANEISIDIPGNWMVLDQGARKTLDSIVTELFDKSGITNKLAIKDKFRGYCSFMAAYYDGTGDKAKIIVRNYPDSQFTQQDMQNKQFIKDFEQGLKEGAAKGAKAGNARIRITYWGKGYKQNIAGKIALINTYRRSAYPGQKGTFFVKIIRFFDGPKTFSITISYNEIEKSTLEPICNKILESLRFIQ